MMAHAQNSPETGQGTPQEQQTQLPGRVPRLKETIRSEPEYSDVSSDFERLLGEAKANVTANQGVCFVNLVKARQMLAEAGVVLAGYTDQATIYDTIEQAQAAGAFTTADASAARERTHVTVETRPARVAVTPQQARVMVEREATEVAVSQKPSEITVQQPQSTIAVQQAKPNVDVNQPAPDVQVQAAAPEVEVQQPAPEI